MTASVITTEQHEHLLSLTRFTNLVLVVDREAIRIALNELARLRYILKAWKPYVSIARNGVDATRAEDARRALALAGEE